MLDLVFLHSCIMSVVMYSSEILELVCSEYLCMKEKIIVFCYPGFMIF
jgi:hypothetical protein